jgi:rhamnosyltransferase subunit B
MPLAHDQFDNAERLRRLNVGDWLRQAFFSGKRVAKRLDRLLNSESVARSCRDLAQKLAKRNGLCQTAAAIEDWVAKNPATSLRGKHQNIA